MPITHLLESGGVSRASEDLFVFFLSFSSFLFFVSLFLSLLPSFLRFLAWIIPMVLSQGCQTHFYWGRISLTVAFKGPNVTLGLCEWNYS